MKSEIKLLDIAVSYDVRGSGPSVILLHGWGCSSATVASIATAICDRFKVYSIDLPGFGDSGEPTSVWGSIEYCTMLEDFVKKLSIDNPILIGHSFGGKVSILYAASNSVSKLVLVGSAGIKPSHSLLYYYKVYSYKLFKYLTPILVGRKRGEQIISERRARSASADYNAASPMMRSILVNVVNEDAREYMKRVAAPTLLMWGVNDSATPLSDGKAINKLISDSGLVVFDNSGHYTFLDESYKFNVVLNKFLG